MAFWSGFRRLGKHRDYQRGIVHYNRGEFAEAASAFEAALAAMSDPADPQYSLGTFYAATDGVLIALAGPVLEADQHLAWGVRGGDGGGDGHGEEDARQGDQGQRVGQPDPHPGP